MSGKFKRSSGVSIENDLSLSIMVYTSISFSISLKISRSSIFSKLDFKTEKIDFKPKEEHQYELNVEL